MEMRATLSLTVDIDSAREMGLEIDDPENYAIEDMAEWIYELVKNNELHQVIHVEEVKQ